MFCFSHHTLVRTKTLCLVFRHYFIGTLSNLVFYVISIAGNPRNQGDTFLHCTYSLVLNTRLTFEVKVHENFGIALQDWEGGLAEKTHIIHKRKISDMSPELIHEFQLSPQENKIV